MFEKLFNWENGRQKSGYDKMLLCFALWPIKFDVYLLRFPSGSKNPIFETKRIKLFRPDISEHQVNKITNRTRYILSVGWIRK